jgi:histidinol-phosphate aminotransferase
MPQDALARAERANLFMIARPNTPTGNLFPMEKIEEICENFKGIVFIDEAYADFSIDTCIPLVKKYSNVIVSRTFSKSRCLAGLRFGFAVAHKEIIAGLMKMKDSYNVPMLTQLLAMASLKDPEFFRKHVETIKENRSFLTEELGKMGFVTIPSYTNFIFTKPPCGGEKFFKALREKGILVRYFPGGKTGDYVRITIGSRNECAALLAAAGEILA